MLFWHSMLFGRADEMPSGGMGGFVFYCGGYGEAGCQQERGYVFESCRAGIRLARTLRTTLLKTRIWIDFSFFPGKGWGPGFFLSG